MFQVHPKLIGARLYPVRDNLLSEVIIACWMEEPFDRAHRPQLVVMSVTTNGIASKHYLPNDDYILAVEDVTNGKEVMRLRVDLLKENTNG